MKILAYVLFVLAGLALGRDARADVFGRQWMKAFFAPPPTPHHDRVAAAKASRTPPLAMRVRRLRLRGMAEAAKHR
jgi:hypothetical protein